MTPPKAKLNYPRLWENKKSKARFRVMPWYESLSPLFDEEELAEMMGVDQPAKYGMLVQIGYLLENTHGVWFGLSLSIRSSFNDLGEAPKKPEKKPKGKKP